MSLSPDYSRAVSRDERLKNMSRVLEEATAAFPLLQNMERSWQRGTHTINGSSIVLPSGVVLTRGIQVAHRFDRPSEGETDTVCLSDGPYYLLAELFDPELWNKVPKHLRSIIEAQPGEIVQFDVKAIDENGSSPLLDAKLFHPWAVNTLEDQPYWDPLHKDRTHKINHVRAVWPRSRSVFHDRYCELRLQGIDSKDAIQQIWNERGGINQIFPYLNYYSPGDLPYFREPNEVVSVFSRSLLKEP